MPRSGGENHRIAGMNSDFTAVFTPKHQTRLPAGEPEHLMCSRVVMMKIVNTIAPLSRPAIRRENRFETTRRVGNRTQYRAIDQDREPLVIRHPSIARKAKKFRLLG